MSDQDLSAYERMWTSERREWILFGSGGDYLPVREGSPPIVLPICGQELAELVVARMLAAGVSVVDDMGDSQAVGG